MAQRFDYATSRGPYAAMIELQQSLEESAIETVLAHLVRLRASQLNGCAYCIDMHWKDLRALGESEQRLYGLSAWREYAWYTERERAALEWTEAVTLVQGGVPDEVYEAVRTHFTEKELVDLTFEIVAINAWNRLAIPARTEPGLYRSKLRPVAAEASPAVA